MKKTLEKSTKVSMKVVSRFCITKEKLSNQKEIKYLHISAKNKQTVKTNFEEMVLELSAINALRV